MKTIGLYPNPKRDAGLRVTRKVMEILLPYGVSFLAPAALKEELASLPSLSFLPKEEVIRKSDGIVTLGGDGTILSIAKEAAFAGTPIFGINTGHVGFMTSLEVEDLSRVVSLVTGDYRISSRMLLSCRINEKEELCALNEVVIAPEKGFHIIECSLEAKGRKLCDVRADGLIFNTPTGSTGYSFSAGGAVMDCEFDAIGVKAIASYLLIGAHHMIFSPDTSFFVGDLKSEGSALTVCADGREIRSLQRGDTVRVEKSDKRVRLITLEEKTNHEVFFRKF